MSISTNPTNAYTVPSVSITTAHTGAFSKASAGDARHAGTCLCQRGEQYLLIKSPPASGKSRALMFIALDKLHNQGLKQAIIVVPERSIGSSFADEPLSQFGFYWDWQVAPQWNPCNKAYFQHLLDNGNLPLQALCAVMRKLLHAIHGMLKHDKPFDNTRFYAIPAQG